MPGQPASFATRFPPKSASRVTEEALAAAEHQSARPASAGSIPVIDVGHSARRIASVTARTVTGPPFEDPIGASAATAIVYLGRSPSSVTRIITRRWPAKSSIA